MKISRLFSAVYACAISCVPFSVHAVGVPGQGTWETTLQGRDLDGNASTLEAYYDTVLDITWLADAIAAGIAMPWMDANAWAAGLNVSGITGWRLPINTPINGATYDTTLSTDGTTDLGFATSAGWVDGSGTPVSEMGHMYYVTLGNLSICDPTLPWCTLQPGGGLSNTGPFSNLLGSTYWSGSVLDSTLVWDFDFDQGEQGTNVKSPLFFAWAVHDGDVGTIPLPPAIWLFGSGLLGLIGFARRNKAA